MELKTKIVLLLCLLLLSDEILQTKATINFANKLRSIRAATWNIDPDSLSLAKSGPQWGAYAVGGGLVTYRSSVISSISYMDRGEKEKAMESLNVAIASLTLETTQSFGLPALSAVIDKLFKNYGSAFPRTVNGLKTYNGMLGDAILNQVAITDATGRLEEGLDALETLKLRMKTDFSEEVNSFLKSSQAHEDIVKSLNGAKRWAKVAKWTDFLAGPILDTVSVAFSAWQLHEAIKSDDKLGIASSSLGVIGGVVGVGAFIVGSLATAGGIIAATAGPVGIIIGCILTLASLIIDIINEYNPSQKISEHLTLVKSLTAASKDMTVGLHSTMLRKGSAGNIVAGFGTLYNVNQAMLVHATVADPWDTIKGLKDDLRGFVVFKPELAKPEENYIVVGNQRVFDKKYYANWAFHPEGREEIGYDYYGNKINDEDEGVFVRVTTDMITNEEENMWFWLKGAEVITYEEGQVDVPRDDNVEIGDFRTFMSVSSSFLDVRTGGGNDLLLISGVVCSEEQSILYDGECLKAHLGGDHDTISFESMDIREEKLKWFLKNDDLTQYKSILGIKVDAKNDYLYYRIKNDNGTHREVKFAGFSAVEAIIGSPLNDIIQFDNRIDFSIKETAGNNTYELNFAQIYDSSDTLRKYSIEDNSETPGRLILSAYFDLSFKDIIFAQETNTLTVLHDGIAKAQIFLKRSKSGIDEFTIMIGSSSRSKRIDALIKLHSQKAFLLPNTPFQYRFDRHLIARHNAPTTVELHAPVEEYPNVTALYRIKLLYLESEVFITDDFINFLKSDQYTFIAKRKGDADSDGKWNFRLKKKNVPGGWKINFGKIGKFYYRSNGNSLLMFNLAKTKQTELDIMNEISVVSERQVFNFDSETNRYVGAERPDRLIMNYPQNLGHRDFREYLIDLGGPIHPTESNRNELAIGKVSIDLFFYRMLSSYSKMELERASLMEDWHLKIYANWDTKTLVADITLKNVHAIVAEQPTSWVPLLDFAASDELFHSLDDIFWNKLAQFYGR